MALFRGAAVVRPVVTGGRCFYSAVASVEPPKKRHDLKNLLRNYLSAYGYFSDELSLVVYNRVSYGN